MQTSNKERKIEKREEPGGKRKGKRGSHWVTLKSGQDRSSVKPLIMPKQYTVGAPVSVWSLFTWKSSPTISAPLPSLAAHSNPLLYIALSINGIHSISIRKLKLVPLKIVHFFFFFYSSLTMELTNKQKIYNYLKNNVQNIYTKCG